MISKILRDKEKDMFCPELGIDNNISSILLKIENNKATYFDGNEYHDLDLEIAKKHINAQ